MRLRAIKGYRNNMNWVAEATYNPIVRLSYAFREENKFHISKIHAQYNMCPNVSVKDFLNWGKVFDEVYDSEIMDFVYFIRFHAIRMMEDNSRITVPFITI